jgi:alpha-ketoglutarate-dependent taurine dioxygenase
MPAPVSVSVAPAQDALILTWDDGTRAEFASIWLRDHAPEDIDAHSGQRLTDVADLRDARIAMAALSKSGLKLDWLHAAVASHYAPHWLYEQARQMRHAGTVRWLEAQRLDPRRDFAWLPLAQLDHDAPARLEWLTRLTREGMAFLSAVPLEDAALVSAMRQVGQVAPTNYGEVFDVRAVPQPENLAYSDRGLGLHTDNPYREPVPGFQALHTLAAAPEGGDSLFADGFALAEHLRAEAPGMFEMLTGTPVGFRYRSETAELYAQRPLIQLDCAGAVTAVHYNSRSIAPLPLSAQRCREFYGAYRYFAQLLRERRYQTSMHLEAGELVVFDNLRILHGRTGFAAIRHPRHLRGCYLTRDSVYSGMQLLKRAGQR